MAVCSKSYIRNPASGRCVLRNGAIGRKLLGIRQSPSKRRSYSRNQRRSSSASPPRIGQRNLSPMRGLYQLVSAFRDVQVKYGKYGADDSEPASALRSVVEGRLNPNANIWSLYDGAPAIVSQELSAKAKRIQDYLNAHKMNSEIRAYLQKTDNLRDI